MANFNKVILIGNITRDPELKYTKTGSPVCDFGLATNKKNKEGQETTCYVDITAWGTLAEDCTQYLKKGGPALVEGELTYETWEAQDGSKRSKLKVTAWNVQFLGAAEQRMEEPEKDTSDIPF